MIDSVRSLLSSQLNLAFNLAEGLHRGKWIEGLWLFNWKDWKKAYEEGFNEGLANIFESGYRFYDKDINRFYFDVAKRGLCLWVYG